MNGPVELIIDPAGTATVTLDRPDLHNAFDDTMIGALTEVINQVAGNDGVRVMVLQGKGRSFSAGADLNWMRRSATYTPDENLADAQALARLMQVLDRLAKPTLALVQGAAFGGGIGLAACCDIVVASSDARFSFSEVRLGLVPAVISPYVIAAIGPKHARRYFQTGEIIDAATALRIGLVHEVVEPNALAATRDRLIGAIRQGGANAQAAAKALVFRVANQPVDAALIGDTARLISDCRTSDEGREGLAAFLEKRTPSWRIEA